MPAKSSSTKRSTREAKSDLAVSYDEFKEHEGQRYTGMKIGRSDKWYYDQGGDPRQLTNDRAEEP
jgi:hypothetical protein